MPAATRLPTKQPADVIDGPKTGCSYITGTGSWLILALQPRGKKANIFWAGASLPIKIAAPQANVSPKSPGRQAPGPGRGTNLKPAIHWQTPSPDLRLTDCANLKDPDH